MMSINLDNLLIPIVFKALSLIDTTYTLTRTINVYNQVNGTDTNTVTTFNDVLGTPPYPYKAEEVNNASILSTDTRIYTQADFLPSDINPAELNVEEWRITIGSRNLRVVSTGPIFSGKKVCLLEWQVRV